MKVSAMFRHSAFARWIFVGLLLSSATAAASVKEQPKKPSKPTKPKVSTTAQPKSQKPKPTPSTKPAEKKDAAAKPKSVDPLGEIDKLCRRDLSWGKLQAVRERCSELEPKGSAPATYWRLTLSDDPNDLRKGYAPTTLAKSDVDSRLLLAAGRYHFARGQIREMEDLVEIARKRKMVGLEIDTLKRLAAGK